MLPSFHSTLNRRVRSTSRNVLTAFGLFAALSSAPAMADNFSDVSKLIRAGQFSEALTKVDAALATKPQDAQMRFLKGLILTEQNKSAEAIALFTKLTEDFPDLPEPYNNLAVLFASNAQYDKARAALEMAIRTNPTYATAHENLGDVYAKLASQAYDKALQLDSSNPTAKSKLTMVRTLVGNTTGGTVPKTASTPAAKSSAPTTPATPTVVAKAENKPETKPAVKPSAKDEEQEEVLKSVNKWAKAWSGKDVKTYLSVYSSDFQTPKGMSNKAWAEERRSRIEGKGHINVQIESPQVSVDGNTATVKFRQIYVSDRLTANSRKVLTLVKQAGSWKIKQEHSGN